MTEILGTLGTILAPVAIIGTFIYVVLKTKNISVKDEYGDRNSGSGWSDSSDSGDKN